jgi:hypothetical protein
MIWTSKWRIPMTRLPASRHDRERLGQHVVERLAEAMRSRNSGVFACNSASESLEISGSRALVATAVRRSRVTSRSLASKIDFRKDIRSR